MTQAYEKQVFEVEEVEQQVAQKVKESRDDNSSGISNPRYYEHALTPKKAKKALALKTRDFYPVQF